jgi:uncharacterized membrane protein
MYVKAKLGSHPIHPMVVAFPIAFYTSTLVAFVVHAIQGDPFWFRIGVCANVAGVVTAVAAALPGFLDWAYGIPAGSPAKSTGMFHMLLNLAALLLFAGNAALLVPHWGSESPPGVIAALLPVLGVFLTGCAGWLGWKLVQTHHVGIHLSESQLRLEPRATTEPGPIARQASDKGAGVG